MSIELEQELREIHAELDAIENLKKLNVHSDSEGSDAIRRDIKRRKAHLRDRYNEWERRLLAEEAA